MYKKCNFLINEIFKSLKKIVKYVNITHLCKKWFLKSLTVIVFVFVSI